MPRKPMPPVTAAARHEAALLRETARFLLAVAGQLDRFLSRARGLRKRLAGTYAYKRVDGQDDGAGEPVWGLAGTLEAMLEGDLEPMSAYLRRGAKTAASAASHRAPRGGTVIPPN